MAQPRDGFPPTPNRLALEWRGLRSVRAAGLLGVDSPAKLVGIARAFRAFGTFGSVTRVAAIKYGDRPAIVDCRGELSFTELDERVNRLANALRARGLGPGSSLGILCRNHRAPLIVAIAGARIGADVVYLNTGFSARQAKEVAEREGVTLLVHDDEFADVVSGIALEGGTIAFGTTDASRDELTAFLASGDASLPPKPARSGRIVLLTSGTTGTPKGAPRANPRGFVTAGSLLERMPMRPREATVIGPPLFHGTGLLVAILSLGLGSTLVLQPKFDPARMLDDVARHRATMICVVPVMLQRILALGDDAVRARDLSSLRILFSAGSQLPADVATRASGLLGDVVYNLYGSTEVEVATLATPDDVRVAPGSVGRPLFGSRVALVDADGAPVPAGAIGRIFVGTTSPFQGYTGGGGKDVVDGMLATGDVGHFDAEGRLFVDGRDDEMIVSGGENVFPREVEELLVAHPAIVDAAAVGVDDAEYGKRLVAFVVLAAGASLDEDVVRGYVRENLARYKTPREVVFLDELPRNPTGKVLKRELLASAAQGGAR